MSNELSVNKLFLHVQEYNRLLQEKRIAMAKVFSTEYEPCPQVCTKVLKIWSSKESLLVSAKLNDSGRGRLKDREEFVFYSDRRRQRQQLGVVDKLYSLWRAGARESGQDHHYMRVSCTGLGSSSELLAGAEAEGANCGL